jgi:hypothetical protein
MQQCAVQQVHPSVRVPAPEEKKKKSRAVGEGAAGLMQLEGVGEEQALELSKARIKSLEVRPVAPRRLQTDCPARWPAILADQ